MSELHHQVMCQEVPTLANKVKLPGALPTNDKGEVDRKLLKDIETVFTRVHAQLEILDDEVIDSEDCEQFCYIAIKDFTIKRYEDCREYLQKYKTQ